MVVCGHKNKNRKKVLLLPVLSVSVSLTRRTRTLYFVEGIKRKYLCTIYMKHIQSFSELFRRRRQKVGQQQVSRLDFMDGCDTAELMLILFSAPSY